PTRQPRRRSSRRTSAAAARNESADPLRPRVGTRSTPISRVPSRKATSVVAFPTSTPAITVIQPAKLRDRGDMPHAGAVVAWSRRINPRKTQGILGDYEGEPDLHDRQRWHLGKPYPDRPRRA